MKSLERNLYNLFFSHIYVEKEALAYPGTDEIIKRFPASKIIEISHYKDIFSRLHQSCGMQKKSPKLILAVKKDQLVYKGAPVCEDFGNNHFYYTSTAMNCIYDCEYCYLQGMYSTANIVVFVNIEDVFGAVEKILEQHSVYISVSYDTDILALEHIIGHGKRWIEFSKLHKKLKIELRTKSANFNAIEDMIPQENFILSWTLSPDSYIRNYENRTPSLAERLSSVKTAVSRGWKVRLCFDPLIYTKEWRRLYEEMIEKVFSEVPGEKILDNSIGVFRVSKDYLKRMKKQRGNSVIINYPFESVGGVCSYDEKLSQDMICCVYNLVKKHVAENKIYI